MSKNKKIVKSEVRSATWLPRTQFNDDLLYVRNLLTYDDGSTTKKISMVSEYQRPVYVTAPDKRNHLEKKEFESVENLIVKECAQSDLYIVAANLLGTPNLASQPYRLRESPYLYGTEMSSTNLIKLESLKRNNYLQTAYSVCMFDIETDVVHGNGGDKIIVASLVMKVDGIYNIHVVVDREWIQEFKDYPTMVRRKFEEYYPDEKNCYKMVINIHDDQVELISEIFRVANVWAPDWLSVWNLDFDMGTVVNILKKHNARPEDVICDPRLPKHLKVFDMKIGHGGSFIDQWVGITATTTFDFVCGMRTYRGLRLFEPKEVSYKLDDILKKNIDRHKVIIEAVKDLTELDWHVETQKSYKVEYTVYNIGDNIEPLLLDEKTNDLSLFLPTFSDSCNFQDFGSANKKAYANLYDYCLDRGLVVGVGCVMDSVYEKLGLNDKIPNNRVYREKVMGVDGWIQALDQQNVLPLGIRPYTDYPWVRTVLKTNNVDMDSVSSYPSCTIAGNISKTTCISMLIGIEGLTDERVREVTLGLILGHTNVLELVPYLADLPTAGEIMDLCISGDIDRYDY